MTRIDEATLSQIERELKKDGVWVAPDLRAQVPPAVEAKIEAAAATADQPTYVTLVDLDYRDPLTNGGADVLANLIRDDTGRSGVYIGMDHVYADDGTFRLTITTFPQDYEADFAARVAAVEHPDDLGAQTLRTIELLKSGDGERLYEQLDPAERGETPSDDDSSIGTAPVIGIVIAVLAIAALLAGRRRRRREVAAPTATGMSFTLPTTVLSTVRAAEDRRTEADARADVLALGEAIDAADLDPRHRQSLPAWQAALDHYDVASRILDRTHSPADAVGAIVLARRGRSALRAAVRGRSWAPAPGCYFNPLHGTKVSEVTWRDGDAEVRVPACATCAREVKVGRQPEDVLYFVADGVPAHYYRLDLGAWSSTGYGALDPNLLGALLDSGREQRR